MIVLRTDITVFMREDIILLNLIYEGMVGQRETDQRGRDQTEREDSTRMCKEFNLIRKFSDKTTEIETTDIGVEIPNKTRN